jgi:hypothetical protein
MTMLCKEYRKTQEIQSVEKSEGNREKKSDKECPSMYKKDKGPFLMEERSKQIGRAGRLDRHRKL